MVLVLILLGVFILFIAITVILLTSTLKIQIKDFESSNIKKVKKEEFAIITSLWFLGKIKWLSISFNYERIKKIARKMDISKIDIKKLEKDFKWEDIKQMKKLHLKIAKLQALFKIGAQSAMITSFLVSTLASALSILLPHFAKEKGDYKYQVQPIYNNKYSYEIKFNCIIEVKMVHIINTIYSLKKKGRSDLYERTSNRRAYGYSYE